MRYRDLTEAPLASYELYGDWNNDHHIGHPIYAPGEDGGDGEGSVPLGYDDIDEKHKNSFVSKFDRALVQSPETEAALQRFFRHLPMPINVFFLNKPAALYIARDFLDYGELGKDDKDKKAWQPEGGNKLIWGIVGAELKKRLKKAQKDPRSITFLLTHNEGGSKRHPLTPWMIVHRIAHASGVILGTALTSSFYAELQALAKAYGVAFHATKYDMMRSICTFRAAREDNILNNTELELACELMTQYMVRGTVVLRLPETFAYKHPEGMTPEEFLTHDNEYPATLKDRAAAEKAIASITKRLNERFADGLEKCQGGIYVC